MVNENIVKLRTWALTGVALFLYPLVVLLVAFHAIYQVLLARRVCKSIAGEVAVITGAAHGLGKEIAIELARKGCDVAIVDVNLESAETTAKHIAEQFNVRAIAYKVDVSNYEEVLKLKEQVTEDLGTATILVNNAGILLFSDLKNPDWREMQKMINVNLTAHFWTNRTFLPKMKELRKGHIVAISSASGLFPIPHYDVYTSTKFAVRGLMRALSLELRAEKFNNIHTTTVYPSFLKTNEQVVKVATKLKVHEFYPLIEGTVVAQRIVQGVLQNETEIVMPSLLAILYRLGEIVPVSWKDSFTQLYLQQEK